jgi:hypothetical protein
MYVAAALALAAAFPETLRGLAAGAASVLLEAVPLLLIPLPAALGCGCTGGPSARSLPAALLTALTFGPWVALARLAAAFGIARLRGSAHRHPDPLAALEQLVPAALLAAAVPYAAPWADLGHRPTALQIAAGAALGFVASPCAFGGVAVAAALRPVAPAAAAAVLCVTGIADLPVWLPLNAEPRRDRVAYVLLAAACGLAAWERGASLVHPHWTLPLAIAGVAALAHARRATGRFTPPRAIAAAVFAAIVIRAPAPDVAATETTLADAYAGEHVRFTGAVVHAGAATSLVRYAIACCRADARPVVVRVASRIDAAWASADGVLAERDGTLVLVPSHVTPIAPPTDPFVYR